MKSKTVAGMILTALCLLSAPLMAGGLDGSWDFVFYTDAGERRAQAVFQVKGTVVTGTFGEAEITGSFENGTLRLSFPYYSPEAQAQADLKIEGSLQEDSLSGKWQFSEYSGTFQASRGR